MLSQIARTIHAALTHPPSHDDTALDAYSKTVVGVVDLIGPAVVSVHVGRQRGEATVAAGTGSGVIVTHQHSDHRGGAGHWIRRSRQYSRVGDF